MNENPTPFLDGANKLEDIIEYSIDKRKVSFGLCNFDVFLKKYSIEKSVEIITIEESIFSSLKFLSQLPNLKEIYIDNSFENPMSLTDFSPLEHLRNISISHCAITEIQSLDNMVEMESILLSDGNITKIQGLENLTQLKSLDLTGNQIRRIEGLDYLITLESLSLMDNKIKKIEGLDNLINLKKLYLLQNCIQEIEGIDHLTNLELLGLSTNNLFHGAKYVTRQELMKYIGHLPKLKSFNAYKFPLPERIYLQHNPDCT